MTATKLIYIYTNHALHTKSSVTFTQFAEQFITAEEQESLISSLHDGMEFQALPASQEDDSANDDSESDLDDGDDDLGNAFMFEVPADFELIAKPVFLPDGEAIKGTFILMLFEQGWFLGKFSEYKPRSTKFKYVITWNDGPRPQQLQLSNYYEGAVEPTSPNTEDQAGFWVMLKKKPPV